MLSKNIKEIIFLSSVLVLHLLNLIINSSFGPILAVLLSLFVCLVYLLIYNRRVVFKFLSICLVTLSIFTIFDYVPTFNKFKTESTSVSTQLKDVGIVVLNKVGIISNERFEEIKIEEGGLTPGADGYDRFEMWERSLENMIERPIFGVGAGSWWIYNPDMPVSCPHNEFVSYGAYFGLPVLFLYIGSLLYLFIMFRKKHQKQESLSFVVFGAAITYLISSFFGNIFPFTAHIFYVILGLMIKFIDIKNDELEDMSIKDEKVLVDGEENEKL